MKVIYHKRSRLAAADEAPLGARYVDEGTLLRESDHLVLVLPYSALIPTPSARTSLRV